MTEGVRKGGAALERVRLEGPREGWAEGTRWLKCGIRVTPPAPEVWKYGEPRWGPEFAGVGRGPAGGVWEVWEVWTA